MEYSSVKRGRRARARPKRRREEGRKRGQFIFVCYINFLLRLFCRLYIRPRFSSPAFPSRLPVLCIYIKNIRRSTAAAPIRRSLLSLETVNSAHRHQGGCELVCHHRRRRVVSCRVDEQSCARTKTRGRRKKKKKSCVCSSPFSLDSQREINRGASKTNFQRCVSRSM